MHRPDLSSVIPCLSSVLRLPPHSSPFVRLLLLLCTQGPAVERAVERGEHAALDEIEGRGLAVAWSRQVDADLIENVAGPRPHDHDAIGQHDRLIDVVRHHDEGRLEIGPQVEQMILQVDAREGAERGERLVEEKHLRPRPGQVYEEIACDLPRPRDRQSAAFDFVKRRVLAALDRSLDRLVITVDTETKATAGGGLWW